VAAAAAHLAEAAGAARWVGVEVREQPEPIFRQEHRGRPGRATRYLRRQRLRFDVEWHPTVATIEYDARCDGIFPLIAYSGEGDRSFRRIVITPSGHRDRSSERSDARDCLSSFS
jgi:hypothetical protein